MFLALASEIGSRKCVFMIAKYLLVMALWVVLLIVSVYDGDGEECGGNVSMMLTVNC